MKLGSLAAWFIFGLVVLPAWAVKSATQGSRVSWAATILFFGFVCFSIALNTKASSKLPPSRVHRYGPYLLALTVFWVLITTLSSIAFTYAEPGKGFVGNLGSLVVHLGSRALPIVARYATDLQPPLPPERLFQLQSIVSVVLITGILYSGAYSIVMFLLSPSERCELRALAANTGPRLHDLTVIAAVLFSLLISLSAYFGWGEFEPLDQFSRKHCAINATCYARGDDLVILAAAGMKLVAIVLFPLGALVAVWANGQIEKMES